MEAQKLATHIQIVVLNAMVFIAVLIVNAAQVIVLEKHAVLDQTVPQRLQHKIANAQGLNVFLTQNAKAVPALAVSAQAPLLHKLRVQGSRLFFKFSSTQSLYFYF